MTTTSPSWFPSWPADWPDLEDIYTQTVPRQFPWGLYEDTESDEYKDIQAIGVVFSWVAQGAEWVKRCMFPQNDSNGMFLHLWEEMFSIPRRATVATRQLAVIAWARLMLGTATTENMQAIFAPIFNETDPSKIMFSYATLAEVDAVTTDEDQARAAALNKLHIYHADETNEPDATQAADAIRAIKPTWQGWSVGRYQYLKYGAPADGGQGGYGTACYKTP